MGHGPGARAHRYSLTFAMRSTAACSCWPHAASPAACASPSPARRSACRPQAALSRTRLGHAANATAPEPAGAPHSCRGLIGTRPTADALRRCGASKTARVRCQQHSAGRLANVCACIQVEAARRGRPRAGHLCGAGEAPERGRQPAHLLCAVLRDLHLRTRGRKRQGASELAAAPLPCRAWLHVRRRPRAEPGRCLRRARAATRARTAARLCVRSTARGAAGRAPCRTSRA